MKKNTSTRDSTSDPQFRRYSVAERLSLFDVIAQVTRDDMALSEEELEKEEGEEIYSYLGPPSVTRGAAESMSTSLRSFTDSDGEDLLSGGLEYDYHTKVEY